MLSNQIKVLIPSVVVIPKVPSIFKLNEAFCELKRKSIFSSWVVFNLEAFLLLFVFFGPLTLFNQLFG